MNTLLKEDLHYDDGCFHCGLELPRFTESAVMAGVKRVFCCNGCKSVCDYIFSAGLESYYDRRGDLRPLAPPELKNLFDQELVDTTEFISKGGEGEAEAAFMVEGIHCSACVWLIERAVSKIPGVTYGRINFTTNRMTVRWSGNGTTIKDIMHTLRGLGYSALPYDAKKGAELLEAEKRTLLTRLSVAAVGMAATMFFAEGLYGGYFWGIEEGYRDLLQYLSLAVSLPVVFYSGSSFFVGSYNAIKSKYVTMDMPVALGLLMTFFYSAWATLKGRSDVYFDCAAMFVFLILLGRYFELSAKKKARMDTERLFGLNPNSATVIRGGVSSLVSIREVVVGDEVEVGPGQTVPMDGLVTYGRAAVDESMLTGESTTIMKEIGSRLLGGTINTDGILRFSVTAVGDKTILGEIRRLVEGAQLDKAAIEKFTDKVARVFVPSILVVALVTFTSWLFIDPSRAVIVTVTVLIVSCPCALALAVPAAVVSATGRGSRLGIIVKSSAVFQAMGEATRVVFDKTGTLTYGRPKVTDVILSGEREVSEDFLIEIAAMVEASSEHPLGRAIVNEAKVRSLYNESFLVKDFRLSQGRGVSAEVELDALINSDSDGKGTVADVFVGSSAFMRSEGFEVSAKLLDDVERLAKASKSVVCVAMNSYGRSELLGLIALKDKLREGTAELVASLKRRGLKVTILSGDTRSVVSMVADDLGIDDIIAEVMPADKERAIVELKERGDKVIMVGDGINDGPALARADVGMAMGEGTALAIDSADMVLLNTNPESLIKAIDLSDSTMSAIKQNLTFSFAYNLILIPLAAAGLVVPLIAAIAMPLSSLFVIGNAIRLSGRIR